MPCLYRWMPFTRPMYIKPAQRPRPILASNSFQLGSIVDRFPSHCCVCADGVVVWKYIWLSSFLSCINSRSSSRLGILPPERFTLFLSTGRLGCSLGCAELDFSTTM